MRSEADPPLKCGWASSDQLKAWLDPKADASKYEGTPQLSVLCCLQMGAAPSALLGLSLLTTRPGTVSPRSVGPSSL